MICFGIKVNKEIIEVVIKLKIIGCVGVGVDNVDVLLVICKGIVVVNLLEGNIIVAVEYVLVMMLFMLCYVLEVN